MSAVKTAWNCQLHHQEFGPLSEGQLRGMAEQGQLTLDTLVRPSDQPQAWRPIAQSGLAQVIDAIVPTDTPAPTGHAPWYPHAGIDSAWPSETPSPVPVQAVPIQSVPVDSAPTPSAPVQTLPLQSTVQAAPVQAAPVQAAPVQAAPVQAAPVQAAPVQAAPVQAAPDQAAPVQSSVQVVPVQAAPVTAPARHDDSSNADPRMRFRHRKPNYLPWIIGGTIAALVTTIAVIIAVTQGDKDSSTRTNSDSSETADAGSSVPETEERPSSAVADATTPEPLDRSSEVTTWVTDSQVKLNVQGLCAIRLLGTWIDQERIFAQVEMTYRGAAPVRYLSWNAGATMRNLVAARMVYPDEGGRAELTSTQAPDGPQTIQNGAIITEIFSFPLPETSSTKVRLILPKEAIGRTSSPIGFEISQAMWLAGVAPGDGAGKNADTDPELAVPKTTVDPASPQPEPATPEAGSDPPSPEAPPAKPDPKDTEPSDGLPTFDDLQKSIKATAGSDDAPSPKESDAP